MFNLFKIAVIVVTVLAVGSNLLAFFLEKYYKKKVTKNSENNN
jgi:hypothetical protein